MTKINKRLNIPSQTSNLVAIKETKQSARIGLRFSPEAKQLVEEAARVLGLTVNAFATTEIVDRSLQILRETKGLAFDNEARDRFLAMLDNPIEPNEALKAAIKRYNDGHIVDDEYFFKG